jgi:hypothetical protein
MLLFAFAYVYVGDADDVGDYAIEFISFEVTIFFCIVKDRTSYFSTFKFYHGFLIVDLMAIFMR